MARSIDLEPSDGPRRRGPYETRYDVLRGYEAPPPAPRPTPRPTPGIAAAPRDDRDGRGPYG